MKSSRPTIVVSLPSKTMLRTKSDLATVTTALKVEKYRLTEGRWPDKLEDATGGDTPLDARGQAILYRKTSEGVLIYNTGDNLTDEEGYKRGDYDIQDKYDDPDDFPVRLYNPDLRNALPAPENAVTPEPEFEFDDWPLEY